MILVTGASGMVGSHLLDAFPESELVPTDLQEASGIRAMDVRDYQQVMSTVERVRPRIIVHLAAETDVDRCEREPDHAYRSNAVGTLNVAVACQRYDAEMAYISTTALFEGSKSEPYTEFDEPAPQTVYARSKWEGEKMVQTIVPRHYIIRAGWMFGGRSKDKKFVGKIVSLCAGSGSQTKEIKAVKDKFGSPTYARDLLLNARLLTERKLYGLYHSVNAGSCTRYDMAVEIAHFLGNHVGVVPVNSDAFALSANRAQSEAARNYKLELLGLDRSVPWRDALKEYLGSWMTGAVPSFPSAAMSVPARAMAVGASSGLASSQSGNAGSGAR